MKRTNYGFTLIELLIVVAIIAILAAIAVPNFLEAQTRAKVARVNSDQRSLATAIESYAVDTNTYIPSAYASAQWPITTPGSPQLWTFRSYLNLTTPVSYITSIPLDVFAPKLGTGITAGWQPGNRNPFLYYAGYNNDKSIPDGTQRRSQWVLVSVGPDMVNGVSVTKNDPASDVDWVNIPWANDPMDKAVMLKGGPLKDPASGNPWGDGTMATADTAPWTDVAYDPSNGTNSKGDIDKFNSSQAMPCFVSRRP